MTAKDTCVLYEERKGGGLFEASYYRSKVTELGASGALKALHEGDWIKSKYSASGSLPKEYYRALEANRRFEASLLADGWMQIKLKGYDQEKAFCRDTTAEPSEVLGLEDRLRIVNDFVQRDHNGGLVDLLLEALKKVWKIEA